MKGDPRRVPDYLAHIEQAIERIRRYAGGLDEAEFLRSELVQDAVLRNLEIIGEACRNIERHDADFAAAHPQLPLAIASERATLSRTDTSRWISGSYGESSRTTCPACARWSKGC